MKLSKKTLGTDSLGVSGQCLGPTVWGQAFTKPIRCRPQNGGAAQCSPTQTPTGCCYLFLLDHFDRK